MSEQEHIVGSGFVVGVPGQWANIIAPTQKPESPLESSPAQASIEQEKQKDQPDSPTKQASTKRQKEHP